MGKRQLELPKINTPGIKTSIKKTRQASKKLKLSNNSNFDVTNNMDSANPGSLTLNQIAQLLDTKLNPLHTRFDNLDKSLELQNERIKELESEVQTLKSTVQKVSNENELLWRELYKVNLVFCGVPERPNESSEELSNKVSKVIHDTVGKNFHFDTAHRIGKSVNQYPRPIKVRFMSIFERNEVYTKRFNVSRPTFINEDLPLTTRKTHSEMRKKRKELLENGYPFKQITMDWVHGAIRTGDSVFYVNQPSTQQSSSGGKNQIIKDAQNNLNQSAQGQGSKASRIDARKNNKPLQTVERARHVRLDLRTPLMPFKQCS
jgi:archaellum component FlaC